MAPGPKTSKNYLPCGRPRPSTKLSRDNVEKRINELVDRFEQFCAAEGLRTSEARKKIVAVIVKELQHFTTVELAIHLTKRYPEVGRATIYRTIPFLVKAGILQEGPKTIDGDQAYELAGAEHHDHIVCLDCREIFEFESDRIEKEQHAVCEALHFSVENHSHVIYGRCEDLRRK